MQFSSEGLCSYGDHLMTGCDLFACDDCTFVDPFIAPGVQKKRRAMGGCDRTISRPALKRRAALSRSQRRLANQATAHRVVARAGRQSTTKGTSMKKIAGIAAIVMLISTNFVFAQANPNQGATTGSQSNEQQRERSVPGNPNNPGPR